VSGSSIDSGDSQGVKRKKREIGEYIMLIMVRNALLLSGAFLLTQLTTFAADSLPIRSAKEVKWGAPPPVFPPGAKFAVISGDPSATGLVTVRMEMPAGYTIAPHFHPTDEYVTVLKGTLSLGMGDVVDKAHAVTLSAGGYGVAPANMHHYAYTTTGATIQVHMPGPFAITYVDPADDPRKKHP
jgi:quercetin dioxygenase-like cupin family protein